MTLIGGMRLGGVVAPFVFRGATDTDAFRSYAEAVLAPQLRQGDVVIWDNLKPHKNHEAVEAGERAGAPTRKQIVSRRTASTVGRDWRDANRRRPYAEKMR